MKIKKRNKLVLFVVFILIGCTFLFVVAINIPIPTTFNVTVNTERIEFKTLDNNNSRIPLNQVNVFNYDGDSLGKYNGSFQISELSNVIIERISKGSLTIQINGFNGKSAGIFYNENQDEISHEADNFIEFYIENLTSRTQKGENVIIPFSGEVILGRTVNYESYNTSTALVRSGKITMVGKSLFGNNFFESGTYNLNIGDQFIIDKPQSKAYGFVVINENPAMTAAYRVVGKKGKILTPGPVDVNSGYFISTSLLSRFMYDNFFQGISWSFASLILIATLTTFVNELEEFNSRKKKKKRTKKKKSK